jgi:hypothetical protein
MSTEWLDPILIPTDVQVDGVPHRIVAKWAGKWIAIRKQDAAQVILDPRDVDTVDP